MVEGQAPQPRSIYLRGPWRPSLSNAIRRGAMRQQTATGYALVIALLSLAGCQTLGDVIHEKSQGGGTVQVYPVDTDQAWDMAKTVFRWEVGGSIEEHRAEGFMLTGSPPTAFTWGGVMGAWIEPVGPTQTKVTVVTKRSLATTVATPLTEATFHKRFAQAVAVLRTGQPLPPKPPE